jgi:hypothetical protein
MSNDFRFIAKGLLVASLGAVASSLYILAISAGYVARYGVLGWMLVSATIIACLFRKLLLLYLDELEHRACADHSIEGNSHEAPADRSNHCPQGLGLVDNKRE